MINRLTLNTPYFGMPSPVIPFFLATVLFEKVNCFFLFASLSVSMVFGVTFFCLAGIPYKTHKVGGGTIYFFLEPTTIYFVISLYKKREVFAKHRHRVIGDIGTDITIALLITLTFMKLAQFANDVTLSMLPQAATTAAMLSVSAGTGGIKELTSLAVILNGAIIYALDNKFLKLFRIISPTVWGLALEISSRTLGIVPAEELGPVEESMASIVLVSVGVVVIAVVSVFVAVFF